jgi:hypothetical protein
MPLLDHFREPVPIARRWESFHSYFAVAIGAYLNRTLPDRFFAAVQMHPGSGVEADVAEFDVGAPAPANGAAGGVDVQTYAPPTATGAFPVAFPDDFEVPVLDSGRENRLVAVVELISEGNKDRPDKRRGFAAKCAAYLQRGIGVVIFDPIYPRRFNLHNALIDLLDHPPQLRMAADVVTYAVGYRPAREPAGGRVEFWAHALEIGQPLPTLPLALKGWGFAPLELEEAYTEARQNCRLA